MFSLYPDPFEHTTGNCAEKDKNCDVRREKEIIEKLLGKVCNGDTASAAG